MWTKWTCWELFDDRHTFDGIWPWITSTILWMKTAQNTQEIWHLLNEEGTLNQGSFWFEEGGYMVFTGNSVKNIFPQSSQHCMHSQYHPTSQESGGHYNQPQKHHTAHNIINMSIVTPCNPPPKFFQLQCIIQIFFSSIDNGSCTWIACVSCNICSLHCSPVLWW